MSRAIRFYVSFFLVLLCQTASTSLTTTFDDINRVAEIWVPILDKEGVCNTDDLDEYIDTFSPSLIRQFEQIVDQTAQLSREEDLETLIHALPTNDEYLEVIDNLLYAHSDERRKLMMNRLMRTVVGRQPRRIFTPHITASTFVRHIEATVIQRNFRTMRHNRMAAQLNRRGAAGRVARDLYRRDCIQLLENMGFKDNIKRRAAGAVGGMATIATNVGRGAVELSHAIPPAARGAVRLTEMTAWVLSSKLRTGVTLGVTLLILGGGFTGLGYGVAKI